MPTLDSLVNAFITLFVTADPIGNAPLFLGLTVGLTAAVKRSIAIKGSIISFGILTRGRYARTGDS